MARYRGPKNRIARRFGANIFARARNPMLHKPHPPGAHGAKRRKKSDYGVQLQEKQKLKACYGMLSEKQLINAFKQAVEEQGNTAHLFIAKLECRLDVIVYRLQFAPTIFAAHQLVSHGHILVNGKKVDRRSFQVKPGMEISLREKSRGIPTVVHTLETTGREVPSYVTLDKGRFAGQLLMAPAVDQIEGQWPVPVNVAMICDFLAHHH